jgi:uncharacterized protein (DUF433 family)
MVQKAIDLITTDLSILGGRPVFKGTRVPIESLIWHLERGITVDEFIEDFPTVTKEQATALLEMIGRLFTPERINKLYEASA